jgi:hypothetical protein
MARSRDDSKLETMRAARTGPDGLLVAVISCAMEDASGRYGQRWEESAVAFLNGHNGTIYDYLEALGWN